MSGQMSRRFRQKAASTSLVVVIGVQEGPLALARRYTFIMGSKNNHVLPEPEPVDPS